MGSLKFKEAALAREARPRRPCGTCARPPPLPLRGPGGARGRRPYLRLPTVALLPFLDVPVPALAAAGRRPDVGQVEEAHAHALLQAGLQVLPAAAAEQHGEGVPAERTRQSVTGARRRLS